jgi:hypothetical protein
MTLKNGVHKRNKTNKNKVINQNSQLRPTKSGKPYRPRKIKQRGGMQPGNNDDSDDDSYYKLQRTELKEGHPFGKNPNWKEGSILYRISQIHSAGKFMNDCSETARELIDNEYFKEIGLQRDMKKKIIGLEHDRQDGYKKDIKKILKVVENTEDKIDKLRAKAYLSVEDKHLLETKTSYVDKNV